MALTYRTVKGSPLTIIELDNNFRHFTGSHSVTGSVINSGSFIVTGSLLINTGPTTIGGTTATITGTTANLNSTTTNIGGTTANLNSTTTNIGRTNLTGLLTLTNVSGAILTPSFTGNTPTFNGSDGQFLFGSGSNGYKIFVWINGGWRSGSLS